MGDSHPDEDDSSPFYRLVAEASRFTLVFEVDTKGEGPVHAKDGTLIPQPEGETVEARIMAQPLGEGRYRLCENEPFTITGLHWGDEFLAEEEPTGRLRLTGVVVPRRFEHEIIMLGGPLDPDGQESRLIHDHGGGWELIAGGLLVITVPTENWAAYQAATSPSRPCPAPDTPPHSRA